MPCTSPSRRAHGAFAQRLSVYWTGIVRARNVLGKFTFVPAADHASDPRAARGPTCFTDDWRRRQSAGALTFSLEWLPFVDDAATPLGDLTSAWRTQAVQVGVVTFPRIDPDSRASRLIALLASELGANPGNWVEAADDDGTRLPATRFTAARMLAYRASQKNRGALADDAYATFFERGEIGTALAAELVRRYAAKRVAGHWVPDVGKCRPMIPSRPRLWPCLSENPPFRRLLLAAMEAVAMHLRAHLDSPVTTAEWLILRQERGLAAWVTWRRPLRSPSEIPPLAAEETVQLLRAARQETTAALERLFERCMPALRRWARGRLPPPLAGCRHRRPGPGHGHFHPARPGSIRGAPPGAAGLLLRQAVMNRIPRLVALGHRRPQQVEMPANLAGVGTIALSWRLAPRTSSATSARSPGCRRRTARRSSAVSNRTATASCAIADKPSAAARGRWRSPALSRAWLTMHHG